MSAVIALLAGGLLEAAAAVVLLSGSSGFFFFLLHILSAALVLAACRRYSGARELGLLGATLALIFPVFGLLGVVLILITASSSPGKEERESLLQEFSDYVTFKGHWGERRRLGPDLPREIDREGSVQPLVDMVTDSSAPIRRAGIRTAGQQGGSVAVSALHTLARAPEPVLRYSAAKELELLEERWLGAVSIAEEDCRRDPADPEPCERVARLFSEGSETALLGKELTRYLRRRAVEAWREFRARGGDPAVAVPAEAHLLMSNGRSDEAAELILAHRKQGKPAPAADLLSAEIAAAAGDPALLRTRIESLRAGPQTPEVSGFLAFLDMS